MSIPENYLQRYYPLIYGGGAGYRTGIAAPPPRPYALPMAFGGGGGGGAVPAVAAAAPAIAPTGWGNPGTNGAPLVGPGQNAGPNPNEGITEYGGGGGGSSSQGDSIGQKALNEGQIISNNRSFGAGGDEGDTNTSAPTNMQGIPADVPGTMGEGNAYTGAYGSPDTFGTSDNPADVGFDKNTGFPTMPAPNLDSSTAAGAPSGQLTGYDNGQPVYAGQGQSPTDTPVYTPQPEGSTNSGWTMNGFPLNNQSTPIDSSNPSGQGSLSDYQPPPPAVQQEIQNAPGPFSGGSTWNGSGNPFDTSKGGSGVVDSSALGSPDVSMMQPLYMSSMASNALDFGNPWASDYTGAAVGASMPSNYSAPTIAEGITQGQYQALAQGYQPANDNTGISGLYTNPGVSDIIGGGVGSAIAASQFSGDTGGAVFDSGGGGDMSGGDGGGGGGE
jgi:hypothetical protein